jgi:hypothetical protein
MRNTKKHLITSARRMRAGLSAAVCALAACVLPATALGANDTTQFSVTAGSLTFSANPNVPDLPTLTLNGQAQTLNAQMSNFTVNDATGSAAGYNVTVVGDNSGSNSSVFKQYNTSTGNYGSIALAQNSLTLNSTGAGITAQGGTTGTGPTHQCNSGCFVDAAPGSPVKVLSAASGAGMGTFQANSYSGTSLAFSAPSTIQALGANEVYRVNLVWSLNSGP